TFLLSSKFLAHYDSFLATRRYSCKHVVSAPCLVPFLIKESRMSMLSLQRSLYFLLAIGVAANAAPAPAQPLPANASAPQIDVPRPIGARRGSAVDLTLTGKNLADPTGLSLSFAATSTFVPAKPGPAPGNALQIRLEIPADAPLGLHAARLATKRGI